MIISTNPSFNSSKITDVCFFETNLLRYLMLQGNFFNRFLNVLLCCKASIVVGTNTATCLLSATALKAARMDPVEAIKYE